MYPCVWVLLGDLFRRSKLTERLKTGSAEQGKAPFKAGLGQIRGGAGRLGFADEQGHVWQNQDPYRTALGQGQDRALLGEARALHGMTG